MKSIVKLFLACNSFLFSFTLKVQGQGDCPTGRFDKISDEFFFSASSDQGATGDVVAIDLMVTNQIPRTDLIGLYIVGCYDASIAELLDEVQYMEIFDLLSWRSSFWKLSIGDFKGFGLAMGLKYAEVPKIFPSDQPVHLATLFFRLIGKPGSFSKIEFCDNVFRQPQGACSKNALQFVPRVGEGTLEDQLHAFSIRHLPGEIRILDGEPTRPNPPATPPLAKIYPQAPTPESAKIQFELTGGTAQPGSKEVPLSVYVTSNYEFSGFYLSIVFSPTFLELARVAEHTRPGAMVINNTEGFMAAGMTNSRRRIGAEGERVKLVTLYFNVKPEAPLGSEIPLKFAPSGPEGYPFYFNWLAIHYKDTVSPDKLPITAEVQPLLVTNAALQLQRPPMVRCGDANQDGQLDTADALATLAHLFLGGAAPACPVAADFDLSGDLDISDPIALLSTVYLGRPPLDTLEPAEVPCS
ncbi:MAG: hypothetical protein HY717_17895 [Planctomycetes bacterium]|nr:hypothetical protein [Planctomycetota bacterium]